MSAPERCDVCGDQALDFRISEEGRCACIECVQHELEQALARVEVLEVAMRQSIKLVDAGDRCGDTLRAALAIPTEHPLPRTHLPPPPQVGVCQQCGCTDEWGCDQPCGWANAEHTLCTNCVEDES